MDDAEENGQPEKMPNDGKAAQAGSEPPQDINRLIRQSVLEMPYGMVLISTEGRIIFCNPSAQTALGLTADEICGRSVIDSSWQRLNPDGTIATGDEHPGLIALKTGNPVHNTLVGINKPNGEVSWLVVDTQPIFDDSQNIIAVSAVFNDITTERKLADELSRAEEHLAILRNASAVGLWEWNLSTDHLWHDESFSRLLAIPKIATISEWLALIATEDRDQVVEHLHSIKAGVPVSEFAFKTEGDNGMFRWLFVHAELLDQEPGQAGRIAGSIVDTSALNSANAQVKDLLDYMTDGYLTLDHHWNITFMNNRAEMILGYSRNDVVGMGLWEMFPDAFGTEFQHQYEMTMGGAEVSFEAYYRGSHSWYEIRAHPIPRGIATYFRDITVQHEAARERELLLALAEQAKERLSFAATHDTLTQLPNRPSLLSWMEATLRNRRSSESFAVLFIDLDRFKRVNDTHGHAEGDLLLIEAGQRISSLLDRESIVARLGGDEFVIAAKFVDPIQANALANRLLGSLSKPIKVNKRPLVISASIGIAFADANSTPETLLRDADAALYMAKDEGRNRIRVFDEAVRQTLISRLDTETDLREALRLGDIFAHFQPIFDAKSGKPIGVEVLSRWHHKDKGPIEPTTFVSIAEETGLILPLGERMIDLALAALPRLNKIFRSSHENTVWINVSGQQLEDPSFTDYLLRQTEGKYFSGKLGVELTETVLTRDSLGTELTLRTLSEAGISVAIDDFGTGYSSLSRLARYPVDLVKIDKSFVDGLGSVSGTPVVSAIIDLSHALNAKTCAEGVETQEQLEMLQSFSIDFVTGYFLSRPDTLDHLSSSVELGSQRIARTRPPI